MPHQQYRLRSSLLYSVLFAPRGKSRLLELGMQISQQYLLPFDNIIGLVGEAGAGKSMLIKGMFPGIDLTNDDEGVNIRPLPLLSQGENAFYSPHTYHLDVRFESAFTQPHELAAAVLEAVKQDKRVIVEHFDLLYPLLDRNADLLIGVGEEIIITRPNIFGPEPQDIADIVFPSSRFRRMAHTAEDLCEYVLPEEHWSIASHGDVRHGFTRGYDQRPEFSPKDLESMVREVIAQDIPVSYKDDNHILIGDKVQYCTGPRMHVRSTGEIVNFTVWPDFPRDPVSGQYLLVGYVGDKFKFRGKDMNRFKYD